MRAPLDIGSLLDFSRKELFHVILDLVSRLSTLEDSVLGLQDENRTLQESNTFLQSENASLRLENQLLKDQLSGKGKKPPPDWVKANKVVKERKERKKRTQSFARKRLTPTEQAPPHAVDVCPDCGHGLSGGWVHSRREVIEIPEVPVRIIEHVLMARRCGVCGKRHIPRLDLSNQVVGSHRVGVRLMSLIAALRTEGRLPVRSAQRFLRVIYGLDLSVGEISAVFDTVASCGTVEEADILSQVRQSKVVNGDETGWRQDGQNGYIWSFSTPIVRYFSYNKSRSGQVAADILGKDFQGNLVTDFYGGYNQVPCGGHQRCWTHYKRDLDKLKDTWPEDKDLSDWKDSIMNVYYEALEYQKTCRDAIGCDTPGGRDAIARSPGVSPLGYELFQRKRRRLKFEQELYALAKPYLSVKKGEHTAKQSVLADRIANFLPELFTFVEFPDVPSENNAAERAVRPTVIARKISGGTRSDTGSKTRATLMTLFATWKIQGKDILETCRQMLIQSNITNTAAQPAGP